MMKVVHTLHTRSEIQEHYFVDYFAEQNVFVSVSIEFSQSNHNGEEFMKSLRDGLTSSPIQSLHELESIVASTIQKFNLPTQFSLSLGYQKHDGLYLMTMGEGQVLVSRENACVSIINNGNTASGKIHDNDIFIFTNIHFQDPHTFIHKLPNQIIDLIDANYQNLQVKNSIALVCNFVQESEIIQEEEKEEDLVTEPEDTFNESYSDNKKPWNILMNRIKSFYEQSYLYVGASPKGKKITLIIVCVLLLIFVWSVVLGHQRRGKETIQKKISLSRELITQKLDQIDEISYINLPRALVLIKESKQEISRLRSEVGNEKEIQVMDDLIQKKEDSLLKKEEKAFVEYYDLSIDNKQAKGEKIATDSDLFVVLDTKQGFAYVVSFSKKSLIKYSSSELMLADNIALYNKEVFFYSKNGIFKISDDGKVKKIIEKDQDWGKIVGLSVYNGNLYIVDSVKDEIYKYLVAENGYSLKSSYFKTGQSVQLSLANSIAIDSSVYIGTDTSVLKYTAGNREEFKTIYPEEKLLFKKVFTTKDTLKVYTWDSRSGILYIIAKDGTYEREIYSSILAQANDLVVFEDSAYVLKGNKIFAIDLR